METDLIKQAAIFQDLEQEELEKIAEISKEQKFKFGQTIFKEGEPGNRLYLISEGEVRISRDVPGSGEEALTVLKKGACFGEMSVFDRSERSTDAIANTDCTLVTITRSTDAIANTDCTLVTITRSDFEMLLDFERDLGYKVLWRVVRLLSDRLRITNDNLRSFLAMSMF